MEKNSDQRQSLSLDRKNIDLSKTEPEKFKSLRTNV